MVVLHRYLIARRGLTLMNNRHSSRKYSQENGKKQGHSLIAFGHHAHGKTLPFGSLCVSF
jgi:hypothetical protein